MLWWEVVPFSDRLTLSPPQNEPPELVPIFCRPLPMNRPNTLPSGLPPHNIEPVHRSRKHAAVAYLLLLLPSLLPGQTLRFNREWLQFTLAADSFSFSGVYYFDNPGPAPARSTIFYPFVISGSIPDSTSVVDVRGGKPIPVAEDSTGVTFVSEVPRYSTRPYRVSFSQHAPHRTLEYVLLTTAAWGRPLDRMTIKVLVPPDIIVKKILPQPDSVIRSLAGVTYSIDRKSFMPVRNLLVRWERKKP